MQPKTEPMTDLLAPGFTLRPARWSDLEAVCALIKEVCTFEGDAALANSEDDMRHEWQTPSFNLETDAWVVTDADGRVVGYNEMMDRHQHTSLNGDLYIQPGLRDKGIGTALLRVLEARARLEIPKAAQGVRVHLRNFMGVKDVEACRLHEEEGFVPIRYTWRMGITLAEPPSRPAWPEGVELRPFLEGEQDRVVFDAQDEAFQDHWGHTPGNFENWKSQRLGRDDFDGTLWHIAWQDNEVAGVSICRYRQGIGWVGTLGVRRSWRQKGLGLALLQHSFAEFYRRGKKEIGLGVDAASLTGATRLYEKAGMHVVNEYVTFEKEMRAGSVPEGQE